jgi:Zn-finger nucleic acid-binding protein
MFDFLKKKKIEERENKIDEFNIICPKCMIRMEKRVRGDIILDICEKCGGTWFDKNEVEKLFTMMQNQRNQKN